MKSEGYWQTILKFPILFPHFGEVFMMRMPRSAKIISVQMQRGVPMMWVLSNKSEEPNYPRRFVVFGTGHDVPIEAGLQSYVGTWQNESMVMHLFEAPL